ncbi:helix-turn-helix domain-containing protein [Actinomadura kijaniata]|uniref:helix-turn-helix domain-containing protein n=1 Tax=Actinomadura kijaniata TaxID=46161 RepID=UPI003F1A3BEA
MGNPPKTQESISFGREFSKRRKRARTSQQELAVQLNVVRSYISQVETGTTQCREDFAVRADEALHAGGALHNAWKEFIEPLQEKKFPKYFANFPRAESTARMLRTYEWNLVYGLFQTEEYAKVLLPNDEDVKNRLDRQRILTNSPFPMVCVVMEESVLLRKVGSHEIMREQLEQLLAISERPNTFLQVLPTVYHRGVGGAFTIATQANRSEMVYAENALGGETSIDPALLSIVNETFVRLQARALNTEDTRAFIRKVIDERWT